MEESGISGRSHQFQRRMADGEYVLAVSGETRDAALFGDNLVLKKTISTQLGSNSDGFEPDRLQRWVGRQKAGAQKSTLGFYVPAGF